MNHYLIYALARSLRDFANNLDAMLDQTGHDPRTVDTAGQEPAAPAEPPIQPATNVKPFPPFAGLYAPGQQAQEQPQATPVVQAQPHPAAVTTPIQPHVAAPVPQPDLTLAQVQEVIGGYIKDLDESHQNQILALIQSYGVDRVSGLPPEVYTEFLLKAKEIASG